MAFSSFHIIIGITGTANGCIFSETATVGVINSNNTVDNSSSYKVYPNPTSALLYVELNNMNASQIDIIDVIGRTIISTTDINTRNTFNLEGLNSGIYFVKIQTENKVYTHKIVTK